MDAKEILSKVDHTLLKPVSTTEQIDALCKEALENHTASVCIPPCFIKHVKETFPDLNICTVIGFPLGYNTLNVKVLETKEALNDGANEIDMVINQGYVKEKKYNLVTEEIREIKKACGSHILKVIVETCNLTEDEKVEVCKCVSDAGADFIKTSTGFGSAGATVADVKLFKANIKPGVKVKAAGGIRTKEDLEAYVNEGVDRIGCSGAIKALK